MTLEWFQKESSKVYTLRENDVSEYSYVVLEINGAVSVYDGLEYVGDILQAPHDLSLADGSFRRFVDALAKQLGFQVKPEPGMPHCFRMVE